MSRLKDALISGVVLLLARGQRHLPDESRRIVPRAETNRRAENALLLLLALTTFCSIAFVVLYALDRIGHQTQLLGLALGLAFLSLAAACAVVARKLVVTEVLAHDYPQTAHKPEQEEIEQLVAEGGERFTRRRLVVVAGAGAATALGAALLVPVLSLGPAFDVDDYLRTPWRRGRLLVDEEGRPLAADEVQEADFYTAYPEGANREQFAAPLVLVRLAPATLQLPQGRHDWAPHGILAYSKICTHAGCAVSLYRTPTFQPTQPKPALVCPCHYSTFDPATGGTVTFGPAGRPLPQLPLAIDAKGRLRAAGNFSGPVGPAWWGVREFKPK